MSKKVVYIKHKVKKFGVDKIKVGDYIEYNDKVYKFEGYDYGTYPIARDIETNEQIQLPHY